VGTLFSTEICRNVAKFKSFDRRIQIVLDHIDALDRSDADKCFDLVIEKARYPQHFAEIVACFALAPISQKAQRLVNYAERADQHPRQIGGAAWVLSKLGYNAEALRLWRSKVEKFDSEHSNLAAQMLAYGLNISGAEDEAKLKIASHRHANPGTPEDLYDDPNIGKIVYLRSLFRYFPN
jgi:hypothetical protein